MASATVIWFMKNTPVCALVYEQTKARTPNVLAYLCKRVSTVALGGMRQNGPGAWYSPQPSGASLIGSGDRADLRIVQLIKVVREAA